MAAPIGFAIFLAHHEPLVDGSFSGVLGARATRIETFGEPDQLILLEHEAGEEFLASFTMHNAGPFSVTVERVLQPHEFGKRSFFFPVELLIHPSERVAGDEYKYVPYEEWERFAPFSLDPGQARRVAVRYRFGECGLSKGTTMADDGYSATFSLLGFDRQMEFQLPYTLAMEGVPGGGCN
jgi:hypothetical protein